MIPSSAFATDMSIEKEYTMGSIQDMLLEYLNNKDIILQPETEAFYDYVVEQLLEHTDKELCSLEQYDLIHAYMAEYKVTYEDFLFYSDILTNSDESLPLATSDGIDNDCVIFNSGEGTVDFVLSDTFLLKTIKDIAAENKEKQAETQSITTNSYSGSKAAEYAIKYADDYNSTYPKYSSDCTNFVSQCLYAGGIGMNGSNTSTGTFDSTSEWYCIYLKSVLGSRKYAVTTSWIRVSDFNTYMSKKASTSTKTTVSSLISACSIGDVVLLADKSTGTPYHAIIISDKGSSTAYFCGHTNSRKNADVKEYLDDSNDQFKLFEF